MVDCITGDKGWTLEYVLALSFRQIATIWERYWDRTMWKLAQQAKMSGLGLLGGGTSSNTSSGESGLTDSSDSAKFIDATSDDGIMEMQARGLPIKFIPAQQ